jgi:aldehyde dehydrogenase (NAD+)
LALHVFTTDQKFATHVVNRVSSGAVLVNESCFDNNKSPQPICGINHSGLGKSHGHFGFLEFSNQKAVVVQWLPWHISALLRPPYGKLSKVLSNFLIKYIS